MNNNELCRLTVVVIINNNELNNNELFRSRRPKSVFLLIAGHRNTRYLLIANKF